MIWHILLVLATAGLAYGAGGYIGLRYGWTLGFECGRCAAEERMLDCISEVKQAAER